MSIEVLQVKGSCHLQDRGRPAQGALGIPLGGFADAISAHLANELVGQSAYTPLLECTLGGPSLLFHEPCSIAITGADVQARIDGVLIPQWHRFQVEQGSTLTCKHMQNGMRSYIAFSRTLLVETWRGSTSPIILGETILPTASVLLKGGVLRFSAEDKLKYNRIAKTYTQVPNYLELDKRDSSIVLQLEDAPETTFITKNKELLAELTSSVWKVSPVSSRMGIRLEGPSLSLGKAGGLMRSGPVLPGTVQLLPDGNLIITHVDSQTMGGYPRIGLINALGLGVLAQAELGRTALQFQF